MSASVAEGPSKVIEGYSTVPMQVFRGIVHGDRSSHVILIPGVILATASHHTCECLAIMMHGNLPSKLSVQFDGTSNNKCIAKFAYLAYVLEGVLSSVRVRCLLEQHHVHDVYDAVHAVHAGRARRSTFLCLDELRSIIRGAHERIRSEVVLNSSDVRDIWECLAPGYTQQCTCEFALANAAFTSYVFCKSFASSS